MSGERREPELLNLVGAEDPRDVIHRVVACLAQGGVAILPTETNYVLAAGAGHASAVERLRAAKGKGPDRPLTLGLRGAGEISDWVPNASLAAKKLARRAWPGPMTLILEGDVSQGLAASLPATVRSVVAPHSSIGLRIPAHEALREIRELLPGPLVLSDAPSKDGRRAKSIDELEPGLDVNMIVDDGPSIFRERNSVVQHDAMGWTLLRSGAIPEDHLRRMGGRIVLFVCTGNTCRSPMAEAICRLILADRLGCEPEELDTRGYLIASAGIAANGGSKAAREAAEVVKARGGSLREHSSRQLTDDMITGADLIVAMTRDHRDAILDEHPDVEERVCLLHQDGEDIADPIGTDRPTYLRTAQEIENHLRGLLTTILTLP